MGKNIKIKQLKPVRKNLIGLCFREAIMKILYVNIKPDGLSSQK